MAIISCLAVREYTLSVSTVLEIVWQNNNDVINTNSVFGLTRSHANNITSRLAISNIRTSQAGVYTCVVNMTIPGVVEDHQVRKTSTVNVISKHDTYTLFH